MPETHVISPGSIRGRLCRARPERERNPPDPPATQWLEGGESSGPLPLTLPSPFSRQQYRLALFHAWLYTHRAERTDCHAVRVRDFPHERRVRTALCQITAFTVPTLITLGLSIYGLIGRQAGPKTYSLIAVGLRMLRLRISS